MNCLLVACLQGLFALFQQADTEPGFGLHAVTDEVNIPALKYLQVYSTTWKHHHV